MRNCLCYLKYCCCCSVTKSCLTFVTLQTVTCWASLSMGFPRQEYWSELPFSTPGDLPDSGMECASLAPSALAGRFFTSGITWEALSSLKKTYLGGAFLRPCS